MNILDKFKIILFCFHTFGVRYPRSGKQPGFGYGKIGLDPDPDPEPWLYSLQRASDTKSMKTQKKALKIR